MALPKSKIELRYVLRKEDPRRMAERFGGRVAFPDVKALAQQAVGYERDNNLRNEISQMSVFDKSAYMDIQKRIRNVGLEKENTLTFLAGAQSEEERDFYNQKLKVLDNLLNELKTDLNRSTLNMDYLYDLETKGDIAKSRKDEIASSIYGEPPVMDFSRTFSPIGQTSKTVYGTPKGEPEEEEEWGEITGHGETLKPPSATAPTEDVMLIATRARDSLYDDYKSNRITYKTALAGLRQIRDRYNIRNNTKFQMKSFAPLEEVE